MLCLRVEDLGGKASVGNPSLRLKLPESRVRPLSWDCLWPMTPKNTSSLWTRKLPRESEAARAASLSIGVLYGLLNTNCLQRILRRLTQIHWVTGCCLRSSFESFCDFDSFICRLFKRKPALKVQVLVHPGVEVGVQFMRLLVILNIQTSCYTLSGWASTKLSADRCPGPLAARAASPSCPPSFAASPESTVEAPRIIQKWGVPKSWGYPQSSSILDGDFP